MSAFLCRKLVYMTTFEQQLTQKCQQLLGTASRHFQRQFPAPDIRFNVRGKVAGKALLQHNTIHLNPVLATENPQAFIDEVLPHELAHLIAFQVYGRVRPHGKEWQHIMSNIFGVTPSRTHTMDVSSVQGKTFEYRCGCQSVALTIRRHNKVLRQQASYACRQCGEKLVFTGTRLT